ncbi:SHOCT domain-containing protein [Lentibacillus salinarum]|uniref:SHOCT domain-containing protein n=1 Tax=Lentibacillus salinarum TaxID=446820 RepID=A0ABW3ZXP9_9BACI
MMSMMGGSMILNMVIWIIVLGFLIYGIVLLILKPFEKKENSSIQILRERYARGEIDDQEFEAKKAVLRNKD